MIDGRAKERAALQAFCELSRELLHLPYGSHLRHVFSQHLEVFEKNCAPVFMVGLKDGASSERIFNLTKYPGVRHRAAPNQDSVASGLSPFLESSLDRHDIAATRHRHANSLFNPSNQIPISQSLVALLLRATVQRNVLYAAAFGKSRGLHSIDSVIVVARANLYRERNLYTLLYLFQDCFEPLVVAQKARASAVLYDLRRGAAAVDIQDVRSHLFGHLRSHAHTFRLSAENLNCERAFFLEESHLSFRLRIVARETLD